MFSVDIGEIIKASIAAELSVLIQNSLGRSIGLVPYTCVVSCGQVLKQLHLSLNPTTVLFICYL